MLPAVTSTPLDPTWRPEGATLAYSMKGDIWIQAVGSDQARASTQGPAYRFEPAWSPDGEWPALAADTDGTLDIAIVRPDGSDYRRLTSDVAVDVQLSWTPDGRHIVFASTRGGSGFDILRYELASRQHTRPRAQKLHWC